MVVPGDIVVGDEDGVVVIPGHLVDEVARRGHEQEQVETYIKRRIELGAPAGLHWTDATVVKDDAGRPSLEVTGSVARRAEDLGVGSFHLSLSHDAGIASAVVIAER